MILLPFVMPDLSGHWDSKSKEMVLMASQKRGGILKD